MGSTLSLVSPVLLTEAAKLVRRLSSGLVVEVAAILPVVGTTVQAPILLAAGTSVSVRVTPLVIFAAVIRTGAQSLVLAHTHVDDSPPSDADRAVTRRLTAAGAVLGVPLLSHVVVGPRSAWECVTGDLLEAWAPTAE